MGKHSRDKKAKLSKSEIVMKTSIAFYMSLAVVISIWYYFTYCDGEYKPYEVIVLALLLTGAAGVLSFVTHKVICSLFHIED